MGITSIGGEGSIVTAKLTSAVCLGAQHFVQYLQMQFPGVLRCGWRDLQVVSIAAPSVVVPGMRGGADVERLQFPIVWHCLWSGVQMVPSNLASTSEAVCAGVMDVFTPSTADQPDACCECQCLPDVLCLCDWDESA